MDLPAETVIAGKYRVDKLLGVGGMGAVYLGKHMALGKRVAIKVIEPALVRTKEIADRFRREARAASVVESDHIVQVFDAGEDPDVGLYMVMEYLTGEDLSQRLARGPLDVPSAATIAMQTARALAKAHAAGVVHRDLKPANLFLVTRDDGSLYVKILDFGISKFLTTDVGAVGMTGGATAGKPLTRVGAVIGTPQYMSPEQAQALGVDQRTDVWSLGVVLYEMLAGVPAYSGEGPYERIIVAIATQTPKPLTEIALSVPPDLAALVHEAVTRDLDARVPSCSVFAKRLEPFASGGVTSASPVSQAQHVDVSAKTLEAPLVPATGGGVSIQPQSRAKTSVLAGGFVAVVAVLGVVIYSSAFRHPTTVASPRATPSGEAPPSHEVLRPSADAPPVTASATAVASVPSASPSSATSLPAPVRRAPVGKPTTDPRQFGAAGMTDEYH